MPTVSTSERLTRHEADYLRSVNVRYFALLVAHWPIFVALGAWMETGAGTAAIAGGLILSGPGLMTATAPGSRRASVALGVAGMCMSGLLIHLGRGLVELHFHIFALLAFSICFGRARVLIASALTVVVHHVVFWAWIPASLLNYAAPAWILLLHAGFVLFQVIPSCYVARQYRRFVLAQGLTLASLLDLSRAARATAEEILDSVEAVRRGAEDQGREAERAAAVIQELREATEETLANLDGIRRRAGTAGARAVSGSEGLTETTQAIDSLAASVQEVSWVSDTLEGVADETSIVAINAAVEASRAGQHALGFRVVADHIGTLSDQGAEAARKAVELSAAANDRAARGVKVTHEVVADVSRVLDDVADIDKGANVLFSAAERQRRAMESLARQVRQVREVSAAAEEKASASSRSAQALTARIDRLGRMVETIAGLVERR